ncbi:hypothetical protein [Microvirga makkahensis]|uniref:DUF5681 domain-containing protein n=1 Tax=Microvirga makkahensis TaxID=1128670 RepID=A0A7X3MNB3_9HYPH|nr:hypothetical protein [Microvirga makkahensis]MXQ10257.1 hypothetical protein [Microvirga makkahensis]
MSDDEDVGYGRPSRRTCFKPGRGGNPHGRPQGARINGTIATGALGREVCLPPGGAMIRRHWGRHCRSMPPGTARSRIVQSWNTASKGRAVNGWSVCTTWMVENKRLHLLAVDRER